jgi:hypothetical protein
MDCLDGTNLGWKVSCSALNRHSTTPARIHSWTFQEHGETSKSSTIGEQTTEEQSRGGGGGEGVNTWILGNQLKWFRQVPPHESVCPLLASPPVPSFGENQEEGLFEKEEELRK